MQDRKQKNVFLSGEGDAWFHRNPKEFDPERDPVVAGIRNLGVAPRRVLEIGCAAGARLSAIREMYSAECHGIDPSNEAVQSGKARDRNLQLAVGTASDLAFADGGFDLVIFGFCLYLCDLQDHFTIAKEADRVLANGGFVAIYDFLSTVPFSNDYSHKEGIRSYKMEWSKMFTWHPGYRLISRRYHESSVTRTFAPNESIVVDFLRKDVGSAFPSNPWQA